MRDHKDLIELTNRLNELDFLKKYGIFYDWNLIGTRFILEQHSYELYWTDITLNRSNPYVEFEYVLSNVPPEIQEKLLFHLDLFG